MDVPKEQWNDYLLDKKGRTILKQINPPTDRELVNDKFAFYRHCIASDLAVIPTLCVIDKNAINPDKADVVVNSKKEWEKKLQDTDDKLFIKLIDGTYGIDAFSTYRINQQWHYCGEIGTAADLYEFTIQRLGARRGWVVQPLIRAHGEFDQITSSNALCTIRAVTRLVDGITQVLYAVLRIPVGDNITDNFSHGTSGNIIAPIDLKTGKLGICRGSVSRVWPNIVEVEMHPDTGNPILGFKVPLWDDVLSLLDHAQRSFQALKTLGWDIAVTDKGPIIVEANSTYDVDIIQVSHQITLGKIFSAWIEEKNTI